MTLVERVDAAVERSASLLCVGLDPPAGSGADSAFQQCVALVDETLAESCAYKPNLAFFEQFGSVGYAALEKLRARVPSTHLYVLDGKRGDIASTASAYVTSLFDVLGADAVTLNPLLGGDSVAPFLARADRGVFLLARTSNPGAEDVLDARLASGERLFERLVDLGLGWDPGGLIGFVVGATSPESVRRVREKAPQAPLLIPGVGAQGAPLADAVRAGVDARRGRALIVASRAISESADGPGRAAARLRASIDEARGIAVPAAAP